MVWSGETTPVIDQPNFKKWTLTSSADADDTVGINHGFVNAAGSGVLPAKVWFVKRLLNAVTDFRISSVSSTAIVVEKNTDASSSPVTYDIFAERPHSITQ